MADGKWTMTDEDAKSVLDKTGIDEKIAGKVGELMDLLK